jgi:hypothetical protein
LPNLLRYINGNDDPSNNIALQYRAHLALKNGLPFRKRCPNFVALASAVDKTASSAAAMVVRRSPSTKSRIEVPTTSASDEASATRINEQNLAGGGVPDNDVWSPFDHRTKLRPAFLQILS